jgi:predicted kinase
VPPRFINCQADPSLIRQRLANRTGDASDADWRIHEQAARQWNDPSDATKRALATIDTGQTRDASLAVALEVLREIQLAS